MGEFFGKIMCPIDFDENSIAGLDYACRLAAASGAVVYVVHAVFVPVTTPGLPLEQYPPVSEGPSKMQLDNVAREHLHGRVKYEVMIRSGNPADVILKAAEDVGPDLIVMTTHGRVGLARLVLGSVTEQVVRESKRPVLTVTPAAVGR